MGILSTLKKSERYYEGIVNNRREAPKRRDAAAKVLLRIASTKLRLAFLKYKKERIKEQHVERKTRRLERKERRAEKEKERKSSVKNANSAANSIRIEDLSPRQRQRMGKKRIKQIQSEEMASTDNEWSDLIPKAKVVDLNARRAKV